MQRILLATALATALVGSADAAVKNRNHVRAERPVAAEQVPFQAISSFRTDWPRLRSNASLTKGTAASRAVTTAARAVEFTAFR
jgi:hypothetical protein